MQEPPFIVGRPVTGDYFVNREKELANLQKLTEGVQRGSSSNVVLVGLRRTGKTSVLVNLQSKLSANARVVPLVINCYGIATKSRFAKVILDYGLSTYVERTGDKAYLKRIKKAVSDLAKSTLGRVSEVQFAELSVKLKDTSVDEDLLIQDALKYLESLATEKSVSFVIMLDEFQDIIEWGDTTLKVIRSVVQSQKRVCYVFVGSATTIMRDLVYERRSPFYRQLVEVSIRKLPKEVVSSFLSKRFKFANMQVPATVVDYLATLTGGYPDYVQRLGLEIYLDAGPEGKTVESADVDRAYDKMVMSLDGEFDNYFGSFSPLEREILVALSTGKIKPSEVAREIRRPLVNISKTLTSLTNYETIEKPLPGQYRITDPVFADWLNKRFQPRVEET